MSRGRMRIFLVLFAAGAILALVFGIETVSRSMLFPRGSVRQDPRVFETPGLERHWLASPEGPVEYFLWPGEGVSPESPGPAVLFAHGNGELIDLWPPMLHRYRALGVTLVLAEYRGYGRSAGTPSETAIREDLRALRAELERDPRIDPARIVYHGRSLGGGAVGTLLPEHPPRALILESTFTSVPDVVPWAPRWLLPDRFETLRALESFEGPLLVFHGRRDEVIPGSHGARLADGVDGAVLVEYDVGHNDLPPDPSDYWERIERFLANAGVLTSEGED